MTKPFGLLALLTLMFIAAPLYAGEERDHAGGFLSFTIEPGKFFQNGNGLSEIDSEKASEVGSDLGKFGDARAYVSFALYGLFSYESMESTPDSFDMPGAYIRGEGEWDAYRISIMTNAAVDRMLTWAYIDMGVSPRDKVDIESEEKAEKDKPSTEEENSNAKIEPHDKLAFRLGIFAVPFGQQIRTFKFDLSSIDYSLIVQEITNTVEIYDIGAMIHGRFDRYDGALTYALAVLNGEYAGTEDSNAAKSFAGRTGLIFTPYLEIGASYYKGKSTDSIWYYDTEYERMAFDLKWKPGKFFVRGEYIVSCEDPESHYSGTPPSYDPGEREQTEGWWVDAGVFAWTNREISDKFERRGLEIYVHYQGLSLPPDTLMKTATGHSTRTQFVYGIGCNFHLSRNVRFQALWQHFDLGRYYLGQYAGFKPSKHNDKILVQLAVAVF